MKNEKIIVYTDGGSRGNPGPAALGVVIKDVNENVLKRYGERLGIKTNNEAEYEAVIYALKKIKALYGGEKAKKIIVEMRMDSELVTKQLNGAYKVEEERLFPLFIKIWNLRIDFGKISFTHVPRAHNRDADKMVNEALDGKTNQTLFE